jgi:hypothetical protein
MYDPVLFTRYYKEMKKQIKNNVTEVMYDNINDYDSNLSGIITDYV